MTAVFLDLDGTLMKSHMGILSSLKHAFRTIGRDDLVDTDLMWMIGPPFQDSFTKVGITDIDAALEAYRVHYQGGGMLDAELYDGVLAAMDSLRADGFRLYLATAKPHAYALEITKHFGIAQRMTAEFGPELDGTRNWKGDLLAYALEQTGEVAERSIMVGDRHHDIAAAAEVGMPSIAVRWGYGFEDEWEGAQARLAHARELPEAIKSILGGAD